MSDILDAFLTTPGLSPLKAVYLQENNLTYVPHQLKLIPSLSSVVIDGNEIAVIEKDSLKYHVSECTVIKLFGQATTFEPGAFRGTQISS